MTGIISHLLIEPLTVTNMTGTTTDGYGNTILTAGSSTQVLGYLEQETSAETLVDRDTILSGWVVYLPAETTIGANDQVTFQGQTFQVDGVPELKWNPRIGVVDHIECQLTVVQG